MRNFIALVFICVASLAWAQEWEDRRIFNDGADGAQLRVLSSTDTNLFAPLIEAYVLANPDVSIEYLVTGTADIDQLFRQAPDDFDVVISSAMDLQLKLVNDGYGNALEDVVHPDWAQWRQSLFAFTTEPAAIVINTDAFDGLTVPNSRQELIGLLRARPDVFAGKVGTYDIRRSGLGYLFATQDSRASETYWRLMEVMGGLDVKLYCCSGDMIDDLTDGTIAVAYNVLGSYAEARVEAGDRFMILDLSDFETTMMRTAFVARQSRQPTEAAEFLQAIVADQTDVSSDKDTPLPRLAQAGERGAIPLDPATMTFLDSLKRKKFLEEWQDALIQE